MASTSMKNFKMMKKNWKGRNRLEGLKKKIEELTTLCGVDGFLVCSDDRHGPSSQSSSGYFWPEDRETCRSLIEKYRQTVGLSGTLGKRKRNCGTQLGSCEKESEDEEFQIKSSKKLREGEEIEMGFLDYLNQDFVVSDDGHRLDANHTKICQEVIESGEFKAPPSEAARSTAFSETASAGKIQTIVDAVKPEDLGNMLYEIRKRKTAVKERIEYLAMNDYGLKGEKEEYFGDAVQILEKNGELSDTTSFLDEIITHGELFDMSSLDEITTERYYHIDDWLQEFTGGQSQMRILQELKSSGEFEKSIRTTLKENRELHMVNGDNIVTDFMSNGDWIKLDDGNHTGLFKEEKHEKGFTVVGSNRRQMMMDHDISSGLLESIVKECSMLG